MSTWERIKFSFIKVLNWIFPEPSSEQLLDAQVQGSDNAFHASLEAIKASNGDIGVIQGELTTMKAEANRAHMDVTEAVQASVGLSGVQLQTAQRNIANLQQNANQADSAVAVMETTITTTKEVQEMTEMGVAMQRSQASVTNARSRANVALERLYGTLEHISDLQMQAAGVLTGANIPNYTAKIEERKNRQQGRAEAAQRMVKKTVGGAIANAPITAAEQELLDQAYNSAGVDKPASADQQTNQSAS